jgi:hypothetical protein
MYVYIPASVASDSQFPLTGDKGNALVRKHIVIESTLTLWVRFGALLVLFTTWLKVFRSSLLQPLSGARKIQAD